MCEPTTIAMAAMAAGGLMSAKASYDQGKMSQEVAKNNATMAGYAAQDAQRRGELEAIELQRKGAALKSTQRANMAAKGLDLGYGTSADLQDQTDFFTQSDVATARTNAGKEAWKYRAQGQDFISQGKAAAYNGKMQAVGSLLSTGGQVADKWYAGK